MSCADFFQLAAGNIFTAQVGCQCCPFGISGYMSTCWISVYQFEVVYHYGINFGRSVCSVEALYYYQGDYGFWSGRMFQPAECNSMLHLPLQEFLTIDGHGNGKDQISFRIDGTCDTVNDYFFLCFHNNHNLNNEHLQQDQSKYLWIHKPDKTRNQYGPLLENDMLSIPRFQLHNQLLPFLLFS